MPTSIGPGPVQSGSAMEQELGSVPPGWIFQVEPLADLAIQTVCLFQPVRRRCRKFLGEERAMLFELRAWDQSSLKPREVATSYLDLGYDARGIVKRPDRLRPFGHGRKIREVA
jgi:hypothetical protein